MNTIKSLKLIELAEKIAEKQAALASAISENNQNNMQLNNRYNPGGIRATLERWYADPAQQNRWIVFDGVSVILVDRLGDCPHRSICKVSELGSVLGESAPLTLEEFLHQDF